LGEIERGLVVLLGVGRGIPPADLKYLADKIIGLRIFEDDAGKMNLDIRQAGGKFWWYPSSPSTGTAARAEGPALVRRLCRRKKAVNDFCRYLEQAGLTPRVGGQDGRICRACMQVEITNDGPVTLILDSGISNNRS
jgi:D-aminoacyl-tRNA deacylase